MTPDPATGAGESSLPATPDSPQPPSAPAISSKSELADLGVNPEAIPEEVANRIVGGLQGELTDAQVKDLLHACREFTMHRDNKAARAAAIWRVAQIVIPIVHRVLVPLA